MTRREHGQNSVIVPTLRRARPNYEGFRRIHVQKGLLRHFEAHRRRHVLHFPHEGVHLAQEHFRPLVPLHLKQPNRWRLR